MKTEYKPMFDIAIVVDYLWKDEERHYNESTPSERKHGTGHVFLALQRLRAYVIHECGKIMDGESPYCVSCGGKLPQHKIPCHG